MHCVLLALPLLIDMRGSGDLTSVLRSESAAGRSLSPGRLCTEGCGASWLPGANGGRKTSVPAAPLILCPVCSYLVPSKEKVDISPLLSEVKALVGELSLLVGYAQKAVEFPGSLV